MTTEAKAIVLQLIRDGHKQAEVAERTGLPVHVVRQTIEEYASTQAAAIAGPDSHCGHIPAIAANAQGAGTNGRNGAAMTEEPSGRQVHVTLASSYRPRPVRWLWPDRIPAGSLTLLAGREGIGKSLILVNLAATLTRGRLDGSRQGQTCRVLFATSEDAWEYTMVPRLLAAGADLDRIGRVQVADEGIVTGLTLPLDVNALATYIKGHDVAMLVLDPLTSVMDGRLDHHRDREVRTALEPLARLAEQTDCAVVGLVHHGKATKDVDPVNLVLGSRAFSAVARLVLVAARDPGGEDGTCVLSVEKSNLGRLGVPALTYRVGSAEVDTDDGPASTGRLEWTGETDRNVRDILADPDGEERGETDAAVTFLRGYLTEMGGSAPSRDVVVAARKADFSERTIRRARSRAGIRSHRHGFAGGAVWVLPEAAGGGAQ